MCRRKPCTDSRHRPPAARRYHSRRRPWRSSMRLGWASHQERSRAVLPEQHVIALAVNGQAKVAHALGDELLSVLVLIANGADRFAAQKSTSANRSDTSRALHALDAQNMSGQIEDGDRRTGVGPCVVDLQ